MAASVRTEDEAFSDVRFEVLATLCQLADADHARGKMQRLWRQCTAIGSYVLPESIVCAVLGSNGATALVESRLGEQVDGGIRIRGTRGRIEWLKKLRKNAQKGGKARAAKRLPIGKQEAASAVPPPGPPVTAPVTIKEEESGSLSLAIQEPKSDRAHPDQQRVIDGFHQRYKAKYGTKPTWGVKAVGQIAGLLKKHAADTLFARMDFMFAGKAKWPPGPYSLDSFVAHIDSWVEAKADAIKFKKLDKL